MSISELNNTGYSNETGGGVANVMEIPTILPADEEVTTSTVRIDTTASKEVNSIVSESEISTTSSVDLSSPIPIQSDAVIPSQRVQVDLSTLPKQEVERPGITVMKDIESEIFGGEDFANMLAAKAAERKAIDDAVDRHNEEVAMLLNEDVPEEITDEIVAASAEKLANIVYEEISEDDNYEDYMDEMEKELDEEDSSPAILNVGTTTSKLNYETPKSSVVYKDMGEYEEVDTIIAEEENDNTEEIFKTFQTSITEKMTPVSKRLDIKGFTISKKNVTAANALNNIKKKSAEWLLFSSGAHISVSEFGGIEIQDMADIKNQGMSDYTSQLKLFKIILDHIIGDNKPLTVESFVKSVSFFDYDHLFMSIYIANFAGNNYLPYDCPACSNAFVSDDIPIKDMYKFNKEEYRDRFEAILGKNLNEISDLYKSEIIPISDKIAISFKNPSIYDIVIEPLILEKEFSSKYRNSIYLLTHIDAMYSIDAVNQQLIPIDYPKTPTNVGKTLKSKIITYSKILKALSVDESGIIKAYITDIDKDVSPITYHLPEVICPKCGEVIKASEVTAENLLFMRHQLTALASITRN